MSSGKTGAKAYNPLLKSYPDSLKVNACGLVAEVLYVRLIARADDAGRYWGSPQTILGKLLTKRWERGQVDEVAVVAALAELEGVGLIHRYEVDGEPYLELAGVYRTMRTDRAALNEYPAPPGSHPPTSGGNPFGTLEQQQNNNSSNNRPDQATEQQQPRAGARVAAVDNSIDWAAAAAAAAAGPEGFAPAWARAERFIGPGKRNGKPILALRNWLALKGLDADAACERLIAWARTQNKPQGALLAAVAGGYADDHAR